METQEQKIKSFAELLEQQQIEELHKRNLGCEANILNAKVSTKPGKKYIKVDVGPSGKYMVEISTEKIYGIKAYGVIHRGHYYGTLDEINQWYWGGYSGARKKPQTETDSLVIEEAIAAIAKKANIKINRMDIGITLSVAMNQEQREDLVVMMGYLVGQKMDAEEILYNILHDLNGLKAIYLKDSTGIGFVPRSHGYSKKAS